MIRNKHNAIEATTLKRRIQFLEIADRLNFIANDRELPNSLKELSDVSTRELLIQQIREIA